MKYSIETYTSFDFYDRGEERNYKRKIAKVRKPHNCVKCKSYIPASAYVLLETAILEDEGRAAYQLGLVLTVLTLGLMNILN